MNPGCSANKQQDMSQQDILNVKCPCHDVSQSKLFKKTKLIYQFKLSHFWYIWIRIRDHHAMGGHQPQHPSAVCGSDPRVLSSLYYIITWPHSDHSIFKFSQHHYTHGKFCDCMLLDCGATLKMFLKIMSMSGPDKCINLIRPFDKGKQKLLTNQTMSISIPPACMMGYYKPANDSAGCRLCPANSRTRREGSERCDCLQGYSRLPTDSVDLSCTSKTLSGFTGNQQVSFYDESSLLVWTLNLLSF